VDINIISKRRKKKRERGKESGHVKKEVIKGREKRKETR